MRCPDCGQDKTPDDFSRNRSSRTGRQTYCKPCYNARMKMYAAKAHGSQRNFLLKLRYGIEESDFDRILEAQRGVCAICGDPQPRHVDHDHETGAIRGILCFTCNGGLGKFGDDTRLMRRAVEYLRRHAGTGPSARQLRFFQADSEGG